MTIDTIIFIVFKSEETEEWNPENRWVDWMCSTGGHMFHYEGYGQAGMDGKWTCELWYTLSRVCILCMWLCCVHFTVQSCVEDSSAASLFQARDVQKQV